MSKSRGHKVKQTQNTQEADVFWLNLEEAKKAISEQYEFLAERYEHRYPKNKGLN